MRRLILFIALFVIAACGARGTIGQIDDILHVGNYAIKCEFQGCFGAGSETLEIKAGKTATYAFLDFSQQKGPKEKTRTISWTDEKERKLKEIFEIGLRLEDSTSLCTTTAKYVLTSWLGSIEFEDLNCEVTERFDELVK